MAFFLLLAVEDESHNTTFDSLCAGCSEYGHGRIDYYIPSPDGYAVLLPIVILTSLIDRFYSTLDDKGVRIAYTRILWTFVVALAAILFLSSHKGRTLARYLPAGLLEKTTSSKKASAQHSEPSICAGC